MKKLISKQGLGLAALALLCSSAGMAATISVIPTPNGTCCSSSVTVGNTFYVTLHGTGFAGDGTSTGTTGSTLQLTFDSTKVTVNSIALTPLATASPFNTISALPTSGPSPILISVLTTGNYAFGTFDAYRINFTALAAGPANIMIVDDGGDFAWSDQDAGVIATTYTQAAVTIVSAVPVPAAAWLLVSALGILGGVKRRISQ